MNQPLEPVIGRCIAPARGRVMMVKRWRRCLEATARYFANQDDGRPASDLARPEPVALKARYQIAPQWRLAAGYDLLYWTEVQRAGGLIDTTINPNLIPSANPGGPLRRMPVFNTTPLLAGV